MPPFFGGYDPFRSESDCTKSDQKIEIKIYEKKEKRRENLIERKGGGMSPCLGRGIRIRGTPTALIRRTLFIVLWIRRTDGVHCSLAAYLKGGTCGDF